MNVFHKVKQGDVDIQIRKTVIQTESRLLLLLSFHLSNCATTLLTQHHPRSTGSCAIDFTHNCRTRFNLCTLMNSGSSQVERHPRLFCRRNVIIDVWFQIRSSVLLKIDTQYLV
uniref:Uncharacterized protein n=1 Tax=Cacopsylla melanoneura TaxID=428564 RepID=A0A8D8SXV9_9HEMI